VLDFCPVFEDDGIAVFDVRCRHARGHGRPEEHPGGHVVALVRRGCFTHRAEGGVEATLDPTVAYCLNPGAEHSYDHPHEGGDDCTALFLSADAAASVWGGEPALPSAPIVVTPASDLEHRTLLASARRGAPTDELAERALGLAAALLRTADARRVDAGSRPATAASRRRAVAGVREALAADPDRSLRELARELAVSPHHLSRTFRAETGETIARHRMRLRTRIVLERLAAGDRDLGRLASDAGFADQSHLCRVVRAETGSTPRALRAALAT
jgi:AraC-like DNA-binding protein